MEELVYFMKKMSVIELELSESVPNEEVSDESGITFQLLYNDQLQNKTLKKDEEFEVGIKLDLSDKDSEQSFQFSLSIFSEVIVQNYQGGKFEDFFAENVQNLFEPLFRKATLLSNSLFNDMHGIPGSKDYYNLYLSEVEKETKTTQNEQPTQD